MTSRRARILASVLALVVLVGLVVVLTDDPGGEDASNVEAVDRSTTSTSSRRTSTPRRSGSTSTSASSTSATAPGSTTAGGSSTSGPGGTTGTSPTTPTGPPTTRPPADPFSTARIKLTPVIGLDYPIAMAARPSDGTLWVTRKGGAVCKLSGGSCTLSQAVASVSGGGEQGLLGIAFNPAGNRFYASYTNPAGDNVVSFGQAGNGDLYVFTPSAILRIDAA